MGRLTVIDERRTYPPASEHRVNHHIHRPNWAFVAVWSVVTVIGLLTMIGVIRVGILLYQAITLAWLR